MDQDPPPPLPPELRFLRFLVTALAGVMMVGIVVIVVLLAVRLRPAPPPALPALPERIALPEGAVAQAVTLGPGWIGVLTEAGEFLLFDAGTGALRDRLTIDPAP